MNKQLKALVTTTLVALALGAAPAFAEHGGGMTGAHFGHGGPGHRGGPGGMDPERMLEHMGRTLDFGKEQRTAVRGIADKYRPQLRDLGDRMTDTRKQLHDAERNAADPARVRPLADAQGKLIADSIVLRAQIRAEVDKVLTDAQRAKLRQMHERHGARPGDGEAGKPGRVDGRGAGKVESPVSSIDAKLDAHRMARSNLGGVGAWYVPDDHHGS